MRLPLAIRICACTFLLAFTSNLARRTFKSLADTLRNIIIDVAILIMGVK